MFAPWWVLNSQPQFLPKYSSLQLSESVKAIWTNKQEVVVSTIQTEFEYHNQLEHFTFKPSLFPFKTTCVYCSRISFSNLWPHPTPKNPELKIYPKYHQKHIYEVTEETLQTVHRWLLCQFQQKKNKHNQINTLVPWQLQYMSVE
jgi:hypothetical protein